MRKVLLISVVSLMMFGRASYAQSVFNPNDPIVNYDANNPPATPPGNTIAKWVRTPHPEVTWNTSKFKAYYYNGIAFRMRFPSNYDPNNTSKKYPVIFFMHGGGEIGPVTDNEYQLLLGAQMFEKMMDNGQFDAFMIFPQAKTIGWENWQFSAMNNIIDTLQKYHNADLDRVIAMGLSIGGYGSLFYSTLYPTRSATSIPSSPAFITHFNWHVDKLVHIPIWLASGSLDTNPDPASVSSFVNTLKAQGGDLKSSVYNVGHSTWDFHWKEPSLVKYWKHAHKANPMVFFQKNQVHPDSAISSRIGISAGFYAYEWQRDGITIATGTNGANSILDPATVIANTGNEITVRNYGVYSVRFRRTSSSPWSEWSPIPVVITANPIARPLDQNINLPYMEILDGRNSTAVAGSRIVKYHWTKVSGPASYNLITPDSPTTWINSVSKGVYVFRLTVTDEKGRSGYADMTLTVNDGTQNTTPVANAGSNQFITLPTNSVTLNGSASTPPAGMTLTGHQWSKISGPSQFTIASPNAASTGVSNLVEGVYIFRLTVTASNGSTSTADVTVTVNGSGTGTGLPVANAGKDETIPLGQATVLRGETSTPPPGGTIVAYSWSKISGPAKFEMLTPTEKNTWIRNMDAGVFVFRLTVTDNQNRTSTDDVVITVQGSQTEATTARAGSNQSVTLPSSATLDGSGSTPGAGASITSYNWSKISGPASFNIVSPSSVSTTVNSLQEGTYVFRLRITDSQGGSSTSDVTVTVYSSGTAVPVANAGKDETVPVGQATVLNSTGSSSPNGSITGYQWSRISGPTQVEMLTPTSSSTWIRNMVAGTYVFRLTVTDNIGKTASDDVNIIVKSSLSEPTTARAGSNQAITLPTNTVSLDGSGSTATSGAVITGYNWSKISGPSTFTIVSPNSISTSVSNLVEGTYVFRLRVTDDKAAVSTSDVTITVYQSGSAVPVANAGKDETIPVGQATVLRGDLSTSPNGSIVKYQWTKFSGPTQFEMLTPTEKNTWIRNMVAGTYVYRLTVTDNVGKTAYDDVVITVYSTASQSLSTRNQQMTPNGTNAVAESFVMYPNPVIDQINLRWSSMYRGNAIVNIYDMSGRRMKSLAIKKEQSDFNNRLNVTDLQKGMYFLEIRLPDGKVGIQKTFQK